MTARLGLDGENRVRMVGVEPELAACLREFTCADGQVRLRTIGDGAACLHALPANLRGSIAAVAKLPAS